MSAGAAKADNDFQFLARSIMSISTGAIAGTNSKPS
jgi:hypothetical protein